MKTLLTCLLLLVLGVRLVFPAVPAEDQAIYDWYDTLGYPVVTKLRWAGVRVKSATLDLGFTKRLRGFVVKEEKGEFTLFMPSMKLIELHRSQDLDGETAEFEWEPRDLAVDVRERLEKLRHPKDDDRWDFYGDRLSQQGQLVVLARALTARGEHELATEALEEARKQPMPYRPNRSIPKAPSFRGQLETAFGDAEMWRLILRFGGAGETDWFSFSGTLPDRATLLGLCERIIRLFPSSEHMPQAKETSAMLRQMIAEDAAHAQVSDQQLASMPVKERVADLIFRLRDQNGYQQSQPGACDIFYNWGQNKDTSAAHQLVQIGYDAVPQLIEAVTDTRFSRSVGHHRNFYFSHFVLTVGDCAEAILSRIVGRSFNVRSNTAGQMSKEEAAKSTKQEITNWWEDANKKGLLPHPME